MKGTLATLTESQLDNELVRQKDAIYSVLNTGEVERAAVALAIVKPLWTILGYGYKAHEIEMRIEQEKARS